MKSILITGSTDGIGKLSAIQLAKLGHSVYLHGRNPEKLATTISYVRAECRHNDVHGFVADLSDLEQVEKLAMEIRERLPKLDILINNAGVYNGPDKASNGIDLRMVVNYLAPVKLTHALLPILEKSEHPRIINLSSAAQGPVQLEALRGKHQGSVGTMYAQSKLAITMWSFWLAERHPNMVVIPVNPGSLLQTKMVKEAFGQYWASADKGANILRELALDDKHKGRSGQYFDNDQGQYGQAHSDAYLKEKVDALMMATGLL